MTTDRTDPPATTGSRRGRALAGLLATLGRHRTPFWLSVLFGALNQACGIAATAIGAVIVSRALGGAEAAELYPLGWLVLGLVAGRAAANWLEAWISHDLSFRILAEVRMSVYGAVERIAPGGLLRRRTGALAATALHDSESLEVFYAHTSIYVVVAAVVPLGTVGVVAWYSPPMAAVLLVWLLVAVSVPMWLRALGRRQGRAIREQVAAMNTEVVDLVQGLRETTLFGRVADRRARVDAATERLARAEWAQALRGGGESAVVGTVVSLGVLSALATGLWLSSRQALPMSAVPPLVVLAAGAFAPVVQLLNVTRVWGITSSAADRVFDLLETPGTVQDTGTVRLAAAAPAQAPAPAAGRDRPRPPEVVFEDVHFTYPGAERPALRGISLTIPAGRTLALAGPTGAGKSTLAQLLVRHFDPDRGRITLDGTDIRELPLDELLRHVTHVPQETFLFHDSLRENLLLAAPGATAEDLRRVCGQARVTPFLDRLPEGLDTVVGERGARLSGGERQRISLARALLRDTPVLVLDESSSHLDVLSEREVNAALAGTREGRTTLLIAHRLSTLRTADTVVVLEHGRVAGAGTHDALLHDCPAYARLVRAQTDTVEALTTGRDASDRKAAGQEAAGETR